MTIRWGLIGCGDIARKRVARAIQDTPNSRLAAACRRNVPKLREFCDDYQVEAAYTDYGDLINDKNIDAVYIATPVIGHLPQTLAAAQAGKHVLVEKPMAMSTAECRQMVEACRDADVKLGVAYYRRFYPIVERMKAILADGSIGRPMGIAATTSTSLDMQPGDEGYWRVVLEEGGGGALMDVGSHRLNLFLDLFGPVVEAAAYCDSLAGNYDAEDCAVVITRFETGAVGSLQCFFRTPVELDEFSIVGTKGRIVANPLNGKDLVVDTRTEQRTEHFPAPENLHAPLIKDFVEAVRENREPRVTGEEGLRVNEVMEMAYRSQSKS